MVRAVTTAKFTSGGGKVAVADLGVFTNDVGKRLDADEAAGSTLFNVEPDTSGFEANMWLATRGPNGFEIVQASSVDAASKTVTVARAKDGTTAVEHKDGQDLRAVIPAQFLNQVVSELVAIEDALVGSTPLFLRRDGTNSPSAAINWNNQNLTNVAKLAIGAAGFVGSEVLRIVGSAHTNSFVDMVEIAAPAAPAADTLRLYAKDSAGSTFLFYKRSDNTEVEIPTGGGSGMVIGNIIGGGATQGSVLFVGVGGALAQDNANFFWDDTLNELRVSKVVVTGDLIVQGTTTEVDSTTVLIKDNRLYLNEGEVGAGVTLTTAGLEIDRGTQPDSWLVYHETSDRWTVSYDAGATFNILAEFVGNALYTAGSIPFIDANGRLAQDNASLFFDDPTNELRVANIDLNGHLNLQVTSVAVSTVLDATHCVVLVDASGGARTITLPDANGITGRIYFVKKTDASANAVTLDGDGADTIDGQATRALTFENEAVTIISDGTNWKVL